MGLSSPGQSGFALVGAANGAARKTRSDDNMTTPKIPRATQPKTVAVEPAMIAPSPAISAPAGKIGAIIELLRHGSGASIETLTAATGWQAHSVRGAIAGTLKKKLGLTVVSEKIEGIRTYRLIEDVAA